MNLQVNVANHQKVLPLDESLLQELERSGRQAVDAILGSHCRGESPSLGTLEEVEVALVDDETCARVHQDFMDIPGATDVITFGHGEIVIGVETAGRQAKEYGEPVRRELFRYLVHGLLHLAGHEDESAEDRKLMEATQETLVAELWPDDQE